MYYRKIYYLNTDNIPPQGTPVVLVSNHQNSLNDALAILYSLDMRRPRFMSRGDIFRHPVAARFLNFSGIFPVYRQRDGMERVKKNLDVFHNIEKILLEGNTIILYPEAMHQDRHFLGRFYLAYTRLAFDAAEQSNFEKEIFILPAANHYSDYFHIQEDLIMIYGKPISIQPYYELYRQQPRIAQIKVNDLVREQVNTLMLNIEDEKNYDAIYFLLQTYGKHYAVLQGIDPKILPDKLNLDKRLVQLLKNEYESNANDLDKLYAQTLSYKKALENLKIRDVYIEKRLPLFTFVLHILGFILAFPLFFFGFIHHVIPYNIPKIINRKIKDKLLHPSVFIGLNALILIPFFYTIFFVFAWMITGYLWIACLYLLALPLSAVFALNYRKSFFNFLVKIRLCRLRLSKNKQLAELMQMRTDIFHAMDRLTVGL